MSVLQVRLYAARTLTCISGYVAMDSLLDSVSQAARIYNVPHLPASLSLPRLIRFIRLVHSAKRAIIHTQLPSYDLEDAPHDLRPNIVAYLAAEMEMADVEIAALWYALGSLVWATEGIEWLGEDPQWKTFAEAEPLPGALRTHFHFYTAYMRPLILSALVGTDFHMLYPPVRVCDRPYCTQRQLLLHAGYRKGSRNVTLFTANKGVCDAIAINLTCAGALYASWTAAL